MFLRVLFFYACFCAAGSANAEKYFNVTEDCFRAQSLIFELKLDEAEKILKAEAAKYPNDMAVNWLLESVFFMRIFTSEDEALYKQHQKEWNTLISNSEKGEFKSGWYGAMMSDMYIHRGLIKLKFAETFSAGSDIKSAFSFLKDNKKKYPDFLPDNKNYGFLSCLFSSVPAKYQWLAKLIGFQGDMETGLADIKKYIQSAQTEKFHKWLKLEASFMYGMVQHHLNKNADEAWKIIEPCTRDYKTVVIENYMRATIAGYSGQNETMVTVLNAKPSYHNCSPFYYMDYLHGLALLRKLDKDAELHFMIFTVRYKGKNYLKSAYKYLSWCAQVKGDKKAAETYYLMVKKYGLANIEEDKLAEREANENVVWNPEILKARLLYDGHYLDQSLDQLKNLKVNELSCLKFKLEYYYRRARIYHEKKMDNDAILDYVKVIDMGKKEKYYYAAYSALQLGYIYMEQKNETVAKKYFEMAKNEFDNNEEFVNSIEQKAKAALKKLKK